MRPGGVTNSVDDDAATLFEAALAAVNARTRVTEWLAQTPLDPNVRWQVLGAGKAAGAMAQGAEEALGARLAGGLVVVPDGYEAPLATVKQLTAGHPTPDARSLWAGAALLAQARGLAATVGRLGVWSGGGSALAEVLAPGVALPEWIAEVDRLVATGAPISEVNALRKRHSRLKGGQLAATHPERWVNLVLSDVSGDDPAIVASGPAIHPRASTHIIGRLQDAVDALQRAATARGYATTVLGSDMSGEAADVGRALAHTVNQGPPGRRCWIGAGEPTVRLSPPVGRGGRMQEAALAASLVLSRPGAVLWFAGTDGRDGPTDAAGAMVRSTTAARIRDRGLDPAAHLAAHDAYPALDAVGALVRTGPTRTNVRDLWFGLCPA